MFLFVFSLAFRRTSRRQYKCTNQFANGGSNNDVQFVKSHSGSLYHARGSALTNLPVSRCRGSGTLRAMCSGPNVTQWYPFIEWYPVDSIAARCEQYLADEYYVKIRKIGETIAEATAVASTEDAAAAPATSHIQLRMKGVSKAALDGSLPLGLVGVLREGSELAFDLAQGMEFYLTATRPPVQRQDEKDEELQRAIAASLLDAPTPSLPAADKSKPRAPEVAFQASRLSGGGGGVFSPTTTNKTEKQCPVCTFLNASNARRCEMCESPLK